MPETDTPCMRCGGDLLDHLLCASPDGGDDEYECLRDLAQDALADMEDSEPAAEEQWVAVMRALIGVHKRSLLTHEGPIVVTRGQHHAEVEAIEAGDLVGTDSLTVFAVLRDIADNEPLSELIDAAGTGETVGMLCIYCHAESLFDASLIQLEQRVPHLISCPWRRVVEIVGRSPSEPAPAATDDLVDAEIVCGVGHPVIRGRECDRPEGHNGDHHSSEIQWEPTRG